MTIILATILTLVAGIWRFVDGRGWGPTGFRNAAGLLVSISCATNAVVSHGWGFGDTQTWLMMVCALLAWVTLISGRTKWESWVSVARYGGPGCAIAVVGYLGGGDILPLILYALATALVGVNYVLLHRYAPDFGWNTAACEVVAGAVIIGGLAWLGPW